jgi:hypothetical protein
MGRGWCVGTSEDKTMSKDEKPGWVDFKAVKEMADVDIILAAFKLTDDLKKKGDEWIGFCPFHPTAGKADSFHFSAGKKAFHCFCCKRKGSVLDFAKDYMHHKGEPVTLRDAAAWIESAMHVDEWRAAKDARSEQERAELGERDAQEVAEQDERETVAVDSSGVFLDFAEACRLVTFGHAHARDFVAVRVEKLLEIFGQLSPLKQAEKRDKEKQ